ncbi:hypothetical protein FS749_006519 [Ceratobasidium sp. UAMH 11750]|nr:hypothetical protein FS749_006519 [Ceratobasidium sp. UAMH 11750]
MRLLWLIACGSSTLQPTSGVRLPRLITRRSALSKREVSEQQVRIVCILLITRRFALAQFLVSEQHVRTALFLIDHPMLCPRLSWRRVNSTPVLHLSSLIPCCSASSQYFVSEHTFILHLF